MEQSVETETLAVGDPAQQAKELRKLLVLAGLDLTNELENPEFQKVVQNIVSNYDIDNEAD